MIEPLAVPRPNRWPLYLIISLTIAVILGWSAFWYFAATRADQALDEWRAREASAGRVYECGRRSTSGYPFRLEIRCGEASVTLRDQTPDQATALGPLTAKLGEIVVIAQIYDPTRLIADFAAPASLFDRSAKPAFVANWTVGRASAAGLPSIPTRVSLSFDNPTLDRMADAVQVNLARAVHAELHGRLSPNSTAAQPVIDGAVTLKGMTVQDVHPVLVTPFDADIRAQLTGLPDLAAKPWPQRLRELQAAGGRIAISHIRIAQGDLLAAGQGTLGLSAQGRLDGELQMTVAGIEAVVPALGIDKLLETGVSQSALDRFAPGVNARDVNSIIGAIDKAVPGLGRLVRQNAGSGVAAGLNALGTPATLEGRAARSIPVRFVDGAVFLNSLRIAETPPLF